TDAFRVVAQGNDPVVAESLTRLDPRSLADGFYTLRLTATDIAGRTTRATADVEVSTPLKPSAFRTTVTDLTVTLGDQTVSLVRAYDSLDVSGADFGPGWRLLNRTTELQTDVSPTGRETLGDFNPFHTGTRLYVTAPTGERIAFTFNPGRHELPGV